jgi:hypothetical protein
MPRSSSTACDGRLLGVALTPSASLDATIIEHGLRRQASNAYDLSGLMSRCHDHGARLATSQGALEKTTRTGSLDATIIEHGLRPAAEVSLDATIIEHGLRPGEGDFWSSSTACLDATIIEHGLRRARGHPCEPGGPCLDATIIEHGLRRPRGA